MQLENMTIKVPKTAVKDLKDKEILFFLLDKALSKLEFYRSKCKQFEKKYGTTLEKFRQKIEIEEENFEWWDDFILWEGYEKAYQEWKRKYEEIKFVLQNN
ncbi:hypothetical protein Thein_2032 [Thermodesulfatator indicus DSM 15286]|uniref:Uncharacterized protein n=1 Tax=Thermodesulfatator indicus (strain DSM 15286 / JCM 11887 / CIR29812) TaxID=667014 RepID=F8A9S1_THEID|nr:hypothetical protein [Thermodesulfatator indicus]AEH45883.1 hypothetical protein Thein_2032 [Thermodesulfatator indicus DSM 15286]